MRRPEIDLSVIHENVSLLKKRADTDHFMAVVKANAYGHGILNVAKTAAEAGATWFGVATIEEGIYLTRRGINQEILILSEPECTPENIQALQDYELTPTVYSRRFIGQLPPGMKVHLKVDTGMHRVGCSPVEAIGMASLIRQNGLVLEGLMTHFANANDLRLSQLQIGRFEHVIDEIATSETIIHASNSLAVINFPNTRYDMVRCGLAMYGLIGKEIGLRPALSFRSKISSMTHRHQGDEISYSRIRKRGDGYVGTIPIGYADGIPLRAVGMAWVHVNGQRFPIIAITMDTMMVDFGRSNIEVGTEVELIGPNITVDEWSSWLNTIPYEFVCGLGRVMEWNT